jgi:hypothetical protein
MDGGDARARASLSLRLVLAITVGLTAAPVLVDLALSGKRRPFGYAAADTFYYLVVARNVARHGSFSFDGRHATNGFHPLWQALMGALTFVGEHLGAGRNTLPAAIILSLMLATSGIALLAAAFADRDALTAWFALTPMGVYGVLLAPFWIARLSVLASPETSMEGPLPVYGTLWSYVNGMESGAVLCAFGVCACLHRAWNRAPTLARAVQYGLALAALTLARLDHVFFALALAGECWLSAVLRRRPAREWLALLAAFGLPVATDLAINIHWFGSAMPISGALKTSFPHVTNLHLQCLIDTWKAGRAYNLWVLQREASLFVPALFAVAYLALTFRVELVGGRLALRYRASTHAYDRFLTPTAFGVLGLATYDILFLIDGPSSWYVPVSTLFVSLCVVALIDRSRRSLRPKATRLLLAGITLVSLAFFLKLHRQVDYHYMYADFFLRDASSIKRHFAGKTPHFIEMDDGIVSYSLDVPAMSAGLALDPEGGAAARRSSLFALAYERGFKCIASLVYISAVPLLSDASATTARAYAVARLGSEDLSGFDFNLAFVTPSGSAALVCGKKR